jgi:hypothetical protein
MVYGPVVKPIEEYKEGDEVLTESGYFGRVTEVHKRHYVGAMVTIKSYYNPPLQLTPNHPILIKRSRKISWCNAEEVQTRDQVFSPDWRRGLHSKTAFYQDQHINLSHLDRDENGSFYYKRTHKNAPHVPFRIDLSEKVCRVIGYYIAEGSATDAVASFSFGSEENDYAEETREVLEKDFQTRSSVCRRDNVLRVNASSKILAHLMRNLCGVGARNKHLPPFTYELDDTQLHALVQGAWRGDGHKGTYCTVSPRLAHELRLSLSRMGILAGVYGDLNLGRGAVNKRYTVAVSRTHQSLFSALFPEMQASPENGDWDGFQHIAHLKVDGVARHGGFWLKVREVAETPYDGLVYNLGVTPVNSYVAEGYTVHTRQQASENGFKLYVGPQMRCLHASVVPVSVEGDMEFTELQREKPA